MIVCDRGDPVKNTEKSDIIIEWPLCCVRSSRDSQCFSMGRTTPKIAPYRGGILTPFNTLFLGPTRVSRQMVLDRFSFFAGLTNATNRQTHRHADRPRCSVCSNRPQIAIAAVRPNICAFGQFCTVWQSKTIAFGYKW